MPDWRPQLISAVIYNDPRAALAWLERALGFELFMLLEAPDGSVAHAEMRYGTVVLMVGGIWNDQVDSPMGMGGRNSQSVHIATDDDINAHCARAQAAGAEIVEPPAYQFYGDWTYRCRDPEGHFWTVAQHVKDVSREEAEAATGLKITGWI